MSTVTRWMLPLVLLVLASAPKAQAGGARPEGPGGPGTGAAGPGPAEKRAAVFARASVRSLAALAEAAAGLAIPLPWYLTADGIEERLAFAGPGEIDQDRPAGAFLLWGTGLGPRDAVSLALPLVDTEAAVRRLLASGARRAEDARDVVIGPDGVRLRFAGGYVLWGTAAAAVDPGVLASDYVSGDALATLRLGLGPVRAIRPDGVADFLWRAVRLGGARRLVASPGVRSFLGALLAELSDRIDLTLAADGTRGVTASAALYPLGEAPLAGFSLPGLPRECAARLDIVYRSDALRSWPAKLFEIPMREAGLFDGLDQEARGRVIAFLGSIAHALAGADAATIAPVRLDDAWVVYMVRQFREEHDLADGLRRLHAEAGSVAELLSERRMLALGHYDAADGTKVTRVVLIGGETPRGFVDMVQRGRTVFTAISALPGRYVERLAGVEPKGPLASELSFAVDLDRTVAMLAQDPSTPLRSLARNFPPGRGVSVPSFKPFGGKLVTARSSYERGVLRIGIAVPRELVTGVMQLAVVMAVAEKTGEFEARLELANRRLARLQRYAPLHVERAGILSRLGRHEEAAADAGRAIELDPGLPTAWVRRSVERYFLGDYAGAVADRERALELVPGKPARGLIRIWQWAAQARDGAAHSAEAASAAKAGKLRAVAARIKAASAGAEKRPWPWPLLRFVAGDITAPALLEHARASADAKGALCEAQFLLGMAHLFAGATWNALVELEKCVALGQEDETEHAMARREMAPLSAALGRWKKLQAEVVVLIGRREFDAAMAKSRECMDAALFFGRESPPAGTTLVNRGQILAAQGKFAEAEALYREGLAVWVKSAGRDPPTGPSPRRSGFGRAGGGEQAMAARIENLLGVALQAQGKLAEAEASYLRAVETGTKLFGRSHPKLSQPLRNLGELYVRARKLDRAELAYRRALEVDTAADTPRPGGKKSYPAILAELDRLAEICGALGKKEDAARFRSRAASLRKRLGSGRDEKRK